MNDTPFVYRGSKTREISFPLGGIGTGSIGVSGSGRLIDWEIFNRPNKNSENGFSHFAIKAEQNGRVIDARILNGDLPPPYTGPKNSGMYRGFGFGPNRETLSGLPHFRDVVFHGQFPYAQLEFSEEKFPGMVQLEAFNPFIPLNEFDSGIPAALFTFLVTNTTDAPVTYTLIGSLSNPLPANQLHTVYEETGRTYLHLRSDSTTAKETDLGDLTLAVEGAECSAQQFWFRGAWFDNLEVYWRELTQPGGLSPRHYPPQAAQANNTGSVASRLTLAPGQSGAVRFVIAWNFPNMANYWNETSSTVAAEQGLSTRWKNYYATKFENSFASAQYALEQWARLDTDTRAFHDLLYGTTLDPSVIDAIAANLAVIKSPTVLRLEDGTFYGFEGCHSVAGCCEGSCTHVWNYTQSVAFLFPNLDRSMREIDFNLNQRGDGAMRFRLPLPAGIGAEQQWSFHPCADGQFGNVMKAYADWKISGDTDWLRRYWPAIQKSIEFAWAPSNEYRWDPDQSGVLTGRMHHTLDMELYGPDAWLSGFYLGALKAGADMAEALGETSSAALYRQLFQKGKAWVDANLFNGEYYHQKIDLNDRSILEQYTQSGGSLVGDIFQAYWNDEHGEIKYQIGEGCEIDQMLAQWHANLYGLGEIFDPVQARTALEALFRYNFKPSFRDVYNPCRVFVLNDEAGLVICEWPEGARKPVIPVPYSQEVFTGQEYAAAALMIQHGLVEQGLAVVQAVRARFDGEKRNPWNEFECGSNYARSMSSYSLLLAFSGFSFDMSRRQIGFNPVLAGDCTVFWCLGSGWGAYRQSGQQVRLEVHYGALEIQQLDLPFLADGAVQAVLVDGTSVPFQHTGGALRLTQPAMLRRGQAITVQTHGVTTSAAWRFSG